MTRAIFWCLLAPLLLACASSARLTGNFDEYASYRRARLATTLEARLEASERYLRTYPTGDYRDEVRGWFLPAERRYVKLAWNNLPRLRAYLAALPRGPHAAAVTERVTELESRRVFEDRREQRVLDRAQSFETRLALAAEQRRAFVREFSTLCALLAATRSFGQPTSELGSELLLRFRLRLPAGRCAGDRCSKVFSFTYGVPDDKQLIERKVEITLNITLERGLVQSMTLSGPDLLTRVAEAVTVRAIPSDNPQARAEALGQALEIASAAVDESLPGAACSAEAISPVVLARRCGGVRLEIVAGTEVGALDRLLVWADKR